MKEYKTKAIAIATTILVFSGLALGSSSGSSYDSSDNNSNEATPVTQPETDWLATYAESGIDVVAVDAGVLYEYGDSYANKTVCTAFEIAEVDSDTVKCNTDNNDTFYFSVVAYFDDTSEIDGLSTGDIIAIVGVVDEPAVLSSSTTMRGCHVVCVGSEAEALLDEYAASTDEQVACAESLSEVAEQAEQEQNELDKEEYMNSCVEVDYSDVERNPDSYDGTLIKVSGTVIQVAEGLFDSVTFRVEDGSNVWYVTYYREEGESRILENDNVTIYGECTGVTTYTTIMGDSVTIPSVDAEYIDLNQ